MSSSKYSSKGCGCGCGGNCGGGLGETDVQTTNKEAENTKKDVIEEAKKYINDEIPTSYKVGAGALLVGAMWYFSGRK